jgi:hypothetical protein
MPLTQLPLRLHLFSDGLFVIDAEPGYERLIGRKVTRLGPTSTEDALQRLAEYVPADNRHMVKALGPTVCRTRGFLEILGLASGAEKVALELANPHGVSSTERIGFVFQRKLSQPERKLPASRLAGAGPPPLYLRHAKRNFWIEPLPAEAAVYFQFNQVLDASDESIAAVSARLDAELGHLRPRLLIVDVRHNNGGDASLLDPLVAVVRSFEARDDRNRIVVITSPYTYSAAQIFISRLDRVTNARFAGEPSSSKPNFVGEDHPVELPWSRLYASISNRYHETIPGDTREWIEPEIKVELSSADYFANRDPVLAAVLGYGPPANP